MLVFQLIWIIAGYVFGSIPFGLLIAKTFCKIDPRQSGSKSIGATNISRLCGLPYGIATLICDVCKGVLPVWGAMMLSENIFFISTVGLACVLGHVFSCFLKFRGGKAVATSIGVYIPLAFWPLLGSCALAMLVIWRTGFVSLGSLSLIASLPVFLVFTGKLQWVPLSLCLCVIIFIKHKDNIIRLKQGIEKPWLKRKN